MNAPRLVVRASGQHGANVQKKAIESPPRHAELQPIEFELDRLTAFGFYRVAERLSRIHFPKMTIISAVFLTD